MALVKTAAPATLPASQRKTLANASVGTLMGAGIFRESVTPESLIAPRDLVATPALALTGLGVGASPLSIVQGLITLAVRHAHGNQIDGMENLPPAARIGLNATLACLKKGAGCRLPQLEEAARAGVEAMLALPAPAKKAVATKAAEPASEPAAAGEPASEPAAAGEPASEPAAAGEPASEPASEPAAASEPTIEPTTATPAEWLERSRALAEKTAQIAAAAEKQIPVEPVNPLDRLAVEVEKAHHTLSLWKEGAAELPLDTVTRILASRSDAEAVLRALAKSLGYRIVLAHRKAA